MATKTKNKTTKKKKANSKPKKKAVAVKKKKTATVINKKGIVSIIICAVLTICLGVSAFAIHNGADYTRSIPLEVDGNVAHGIDVSAHNGKIDWEQVSNEVDFAFIRVGYRGYSNGTLSEDKRAKYNLKHAKKTAVPVGVYFYSQAITPEEAEEEAEFVLDFIRGYRVTLPVFIDYEYAYDKGELGGRLWDAHLGKNEGAEIISAFTEKITSAGYTAGVYASTNFYQTKINVKQLDKSTVIWVADYNKKLTYNGYYDIWQYSKTGTCKGVPSKYVDTNNWYLKQKGKK